jgi:hypothetical protein
VGTVYYMVTVMLNFCAERLRYAKNVLSFPYRKKEALDGLDTECRLNDRVDGSRQHRHLHLCLLIDRPENRLVCVRADRMALDSIDTCICAC